MFETICGVSGRYLAVIFGVFGGIWGVFGGGTVGKGLRDGRKRLTGVKKGLRDGRKKAYGSQQRPYGSQTNLTGVKKSVFFILFFRLFFLL